MKILISRDLKSQKKKINGRSNQPLTLYTTQHVKHANYQTAIWKRSHVPNADIPNASEGHGWHVSDGILQPLWTDEVEELTLPESVIDDLVRESERNEDDQSESEDID